MKYLPNTITILRILVTPVVLVMLLRGTNAGLFWAWLLFIVAAISDYVDGKLARRLEVGSRLGQFLDPLADKVLVIGTFAVLAYRYPNIVPWWVVGVIALRDILVTALRSWSFKRGQPIKTLRVAKTKTAIQLTFLITTLTILAANAVPGLLADVARWVLDTPSLYVFGIVTALVTAYTGIVYFRRVEYSHVHS